MRRKNRPIVGAVSAFKCVLYVILLLQRKRGAIGSDGVFLHDRTNSFVDLLLQVSYVVDLS
jgi:hypothetical protein